MLQGVPGWKIKTKQSRNSVVGHPVLMMNALIPCFHLCWFYQEQKRQHQLVGEHDDRWWQHAAQEWDNLETVALILLKMIHWISFQLFKCNYHNYLKIWNQQYNIYFYCVLNILRIIFKNLIGLIITSEGKVEDCKCDFSNYYPYTEYVWIILFSYHYQLEII